MSAPDGGTPREQIWALLPADTPDAQGWTSRNLCAVTGLTWEIVTATVGNLHRLKLIRIVGGTRGRGYLWVRTCDVLPPDRRGQHDHHPAGRTHYTRRARRLRAQAARPARLRGTVSSAADPLSILDAWPRPVRLPDKP